MKPLLLFGTVLSVLLALLGLYRRRKRGRKITRAYSMELVFDAIQLGAVLAVGIFPIIWLLVSSTIHGGSIAQNLPPGVEEDVIIGALVVGAAATLVYTFANYTKHL